MQPMNLVTNCFCLAGKNVDDTIFLFTLLLTLRARLPVLGPFLTGGAFGSYSLSATPQQSHLLVLEVQDLTYTFTLLAKNWFGPFQYRASSFFRSSLFTTFDRKCKTDVNLPGLLFKQLLIKIKLLQTCQVNHDVIANQFRRIRLDLIFPIFDVTRSDENTGTLPSAKFRLQIN